MSRDHTINPSLITGKGNSSNSSNPARTYKAIMPPPTKGGSAVQKVRAIMAELDDEELAEAKTAFIECLDSETDEPAEEEPEGF